MKRFIRYIIFCILPMLFGVQASAQSAYIGVKARALSDSVAAVRWTPPNYESWRTGMENGYRVYRRATDTLSGTVFQSFVSDTIYPVSEQGWQNPNNDDYIALARALCYDFSQSVYSDTPRAQDAYTAEEDRQNRFNFVLLVSDISSDAARQMGLSFMDTTISPGFIYEYKILMVNSEQYSFYSDAINPVDIPALPIPEQVEAEFAKEHFFLSWSKIGIESFYTSYTIEYSEDMGANFQPMNDKPFVYLEADDLPESFQNKIIYKDSISQVVPEYQFRVRGHTSFGETGPPSAIVSGRSLPDPLLVFPRITEVLELADSSFQIRWAINEAVADSITAIHILRYEDVPGEAQRLTTTSLGLQERTYRDFQANDVNYYQVEITDIHGYIHQSPLGLGQRIDSIPPAIPLQLTGVIDSLTDSTMLVQLTWAANIESDLSGYYVYRSNGRREEFAHLTTAGHLVETTFFDTIPAITLSDSIFYRLKAVDYRGNISPFSDILPLARPDFVPPAPPLLRYAPDADGGLSWVNSSSKDVVSYRIERRIPGSDNAWDVVESRAKSRTSTDKIAAHVMENEMGTVYSYRIIAIDDAGLETISNEVSVKESPLKKKFTSEFQFELNAQFSEGIITLNWRNNYPFDIEKVIVYRSHNEGPYYSLLHILPVDLAQIFQNGALRSSIADRNVEPGQKYFYKIQVKFKNGEYSNMSGVAIVRL